MLSKGLRKELRWLAFVVSASLLVGFSLDALLETLCLTLFGFIFWLYYQIAALESWIAHARRQDPTVDDFRGVWGEIAHDVRLLAKRYEKDKIRLQSVVARVQDMTSALADGVILVDSRANIEWWNSAARDFFNIQELDYGLKLVNIFRNPRFITYFEKQDYSQPLTLVSVWKESQHLEFHVHPFGQGERLIVIRDVTHVRKLEQMRKDFVSNVSHELRTPLTVIKGYIETLVDSAQLSANWLNPLKQVLGQCDRMTALITDLITLSKLETDANEAKLDPVKLAPLINTIVADARSLSAAGAYPHEIIFEGSEVSILGKEQELHSAISNLIFNAIKYSPNGGEIRITVELDSESCRINVIDHGIGIDQKHIPRVTERFYRVDEGRSTAMGGTGLGLAIVKHVLKHHGATLKIQSRLGQGSTFTCVFPLSRVVSNK